MKRLAALCIMLLSVALHAAGPRWVAGSQWTSAGKPMTWYRNNVQYFVDAGPLSASVDNAAAVKVVDAAAAVWNLGALPFTLANGGALGEDVSADNVYLGQSGLVWPQDVANTNYTAKQIAVVLDADGSVTDALLGSGASAPSSCRLNGVTETVDLFIQPGSIAHAIIVVNGRCSGPATEQQLQLQYQLERAFGRVIGVGWSQLNDNVFTGTPTPTYVQQQHWPIMHPMDVLCGLYTYQCLPQPFTLRDDDIAAMWLLYADSASSLAANNMVRVSGGMAFPGKSPMSGVNVTVRRYQRWSPYGMDAYQDVSAVTGYGLAMSRGNPVTGVVSDAMGINGYDIGQSSASFVMSAVSLSTGPELVFNTEPINPLYVGPYAVGPYKMGTPVPSGSGWTTTVKVYAGNTIASGATIADAAADCTTGADGKENAPASLPQDGTWNGRLCGLGHTSWFSFPVRAGRTATVEAVATDETGAASASKAMPLAGLWHATDALGTLPGVAASLTPFNTARTGMTQLRSAFGTAETVRLAVTDARGDGRPDYTYRLRVLYADAVTPSRLASVGGTVVISGIGFSPSVTVTVGGVVARILNQSATQIQIKAPTVAAMHSGGAKDVVVTDRSTNGSTTITNGLVYAGASSDVLHITAQPAATVPVGSASALSLLLTDVSGSPVRNGEIALMATSGTITLGACNLPACTLVTDANGIASTSVTAATAGVVSINATPANGTSVQASFTATDASRAVTLLRPTEYVAAGAGAVFVPAVTVLSNGTASAGQAVTWSASSSRAGLSSVSSVSDSSGRSSVGSAGSLRDGEAATVQACAWSNVCATGNLIGVAASGLRAKPVSGDVQTLTSADTLGTVAMRVVDTAGHPVAGASVGVYQAVSGWQPPCTGSGRCASAPVYGKSTAQVMSDDDGMIVITPLQYRNTATVTQITATVGTQGAVTVTLQKTP